MASPATSTTRVLFAILLVAITAGVTGAANVLVVNNCPFMVWPVATPMELNALLKPGQTWKVWISVSRHQTARSKHRIVNKSLDFNQGRPDRADGAAVLMPRCRWRKVCRGGTPGDWWSLCCCTPAPWSSSTTASTAPCTTHCLYSRYHSHHHASIVTEPITSVIHPFAEELVYFVLFAIPLLTTVGTQTASVGNGNLIYIDFMNYLGHCNFELVPKCLFDVFPPLKYLMYTPS
ncbi:hypothetical protein PR202_ga11782 [Eleusine coracana subsp. coracana]|uniref:Uncharacterized protein n=1 Tax=Eleusine coracana subsp. coracana TaxID=191504 RepID=A0AAV5C9X6_ELECO|nr:hypothetical protein PR202_ga11782 [Eleusine coracana subsp. coracana]